MYTFDPASRVLTSVETISSFDGVDPKALTLGPDGRLYGNASSGGIDGAGTLYRYTPATDRLERLYPLAPSNSGDGRSPGPLLAASDGHFYGVTNRRTDGSPGGTVFRLRGGAGDTFTYEALRLLDPLVEGAPTDTVLTQGADGLIYGYAVGGGSTNTGTVFRFDPLASGTPSNPIAFTVLHTFPYVTTWGPSAPILAADGFLYGLTSSGGATNRGAVYRVTPATGAVTILGAVPGVGIATSASNSPLVSGPDGRLYGASTAVTASGAVTSIIRVNPTSGVATVAVATVGPSLQPPSPLPNNGGLVRTAAGQLLGPRFDGPTHTYRFYRFDPVADTVTDVAVLPSLGGKSNLVPMANGDVVALAVFSNPNFAGDWRSSLIRLNPAAPSGYEERRLGPEVFSFSGVVEGADGSLYAASATEGAQAPVVFRVNPATGAVSTACSIAFGGSIRQLSVAADGALYGFAGTTAVQQVFRCNPATGVVTLGVLPAVVGLASAPMARLGPLFYGASVNSRLWPRERPGGSLFQVAAAGATLPPLDSDGDAMPNVWETAYGLDPFDVGHGSGAADDPDGDGRPNAQELADGTHPRGFVTRLFAEGATNAFFRTRFDLANVSLGDGALVRARFLTDTGATVATDLLVPSWGHLGIDPSTVPGIAARRLLGDFRVRYADRRGPRDVLGRQRLRQPSRDRDRRALDDVVLCRGLDLRGVLALLPAAEPPDDRRDRDSALPAAVRPAAHRSHLHAAACEPHHDRRRRAGRRSGEHGRLGGDHRDVADRRGTGDVLSARDSSSPPDTRALASRRRRSTGSWRKGRPAPSSISSC